MHKEFGWIIKNTNNPRHPFFMATWSDNKEDLISKHTLGHPEKWYLYEAVGDRIVMVEIREVNPQIRRKK